MIRVVFKDQGNREAVLPEVDQTVLIYAYLGEHMIADYDGSTFLTEEGIVEPDDVLWWSELPEIE